MVRVKAAEVDLLEQKGTTCCYAKADKFWVRDADAEAETAADQTLRLFLEQDATRSAGTFS
jgi:hypothetical protein